METTRVSSKGQVVIPKSIRDRLHLEAGATLSVGVENDAIVLHQVRKALRLPPMPSRTDEDAAIAALFRKEWGR
ncbi:MAG: Antidote-toxin recognition MazE, bacterial antitoxin [Pseudomonadota bacterium]